jgi:phage terminase large subunit
MPQINITIKKNLFSPKFLPFLLDYSHRWEFWCGSAGSSKSYTITQKLIIRAINEPIKILVCRRYGTTLRQTVFSLFKEIITKWKLLPYCKINESDFRIRFINGSEIIFMGLDDETKLLSLNNISTIFVEEAYEVPQNIVE